MDITESDHSFIIKNDYKKRIYYNDLLYGKIYFLLLKLEKHLTFTKKC